jgi:glycosyltransferase involved in cell wall biosynthesis
MSFSIGIGIVTYNRRDIVSETIDRVRAFTRAADVALVVADDGSSDGTPAMLRDKQVPVITGLNMGAPWNKNRALFLLSHMLGCEIVILLEDDTRPNGPGWEAAWVAAARRWGHVNYAGRWMRTHFLSGAGTPEDPVRSEMVTAQCAAFSWTALSYGGYFDTRFKGYGHAHVEHSHRLARVGFGGSYDVVGLNSRVVYYLIEGDMMVADCPSYFNDAQVEHNREIARQVMAMQGYRAPWGDDSQMRQFRSETESAMCGGKERFRLTGGEQRATTRGLFSRLLYRT